MQCHRTVVLSSNNNKYLSSDNAHLNISKNAFYYCCFRHGEVQLDFFSSLFTNRKAETSEWHQHVSSVFYEMFYSIMQASPKPRWTVSITITSRNKKRRREIIIEIFINPFFFIRVYSVPEAGASSESRAKENLFFFFLFSRSLDREHRLNSRFRDLTIALLTKRW